MRRHNLNKELSELVRQLQTDLEEANEALVSLGDRRLGHDDDDDSPLRTYIYGKGDHVTDYQTMMGIILARASEQSVEARPSASSLARRVPCPLCGHAPYQYEDGYTLPEGLLRHLRASNNQHPCSVMRAVEALRQWCEQEPEERVELPRSNS
jgi:hypothetical protein